MGLQPLGNLQKFDAVYTLGKVNKSPQRLTLWALVVYTVMKCCPKSWTLLEV